MTTFLMAGSAAMGFPWGSWGLRMGMNAVNEVHTGANPATKRSIARLPVADDGLLDGGEGGHGVGVRTTRRLWDDFVHDLVAHQMLRRDAQRLRRLSRFGQQAAVSGRLLWGAPLTCCSMIPCRAFYPISSFGAQRLCRRKAVARCHSFLTRPPLFRITSGERPRAVCSQGKLRI